ncbi:hypothetical protein I7I51_06465 [Histoplasma capsulatum]|uniref:RING-type domain-containing protein n=1 Tax=Ajellomyces capsulatus TaxID=5037 RepID=A0A8A1MI81_AJECA|nr:hypothetical protein I7I51_06465 [Histoplasma capsulatum]
MSQADPPSQHSTSNAYMFGQTSNPPISHHWVYMPVNRAGMAGRPSYASPGATIPANLQASASESAAYSYQSQGQTFHMPDDYHNTQFNPRGSTNNGGLNGPTLPHPIDAFPTENQANAVGTFTSLRVPPRVTTASRRRPRHTINRAMPQPGSMPHSNRHNHSASAINMGALGDTPRSYVQQARSNYLRALAHYPNDTDGFLLTEERECRRRFLESRSRNNAEPVTPVKGLDCAEDGRPEPKETEELTVTLECKACMSQLIDTVMLPCGHAVLCHWCARQHMLSSRMDEAKPCPMCREHVKQNVFYPFNS